MKRLHGLKMKYKVILVLVGMTALVIAAFAALALGVFRHAIREEVLGTSRFFSRYLASSLAGKVSRAGHVLETLGATEGLEKLTPARAARFLDRGRVWTGNIFSDIWYFSADGVCRATSPESPEAVGQPFWELPSLAEPVTRLRKTGKPVIVGSFREAKREQKALLLSPVGTGGAFLSALVSFSEWRTFSRAGARAGYAALVDDQGLLVSLDPDERGLKGSRYEIRTAAGAGLGPHELTRDMPGVRVLDEETGMITLAGTTPVSGQSELLTVTPVEPLGFRLVVGIPESAAFHSVSELRSHILVLTAVALLAAALLGAAFAGGVVRPLTTLRRHVEQLASGVEAGELDWRYDDEIGVLGRALNKMARTLRRERVMKDVFGFSSAEEDRGE